MKLSVSRRSVLKTFAGLSAGAATHFSGLLGDAFAQAASPPLRLICLTQPHGYTPFWRPRMPDGSPAAETGWRLDFDPDSCLGPLERHKDSMVLLDGLDFYCAYGPNSTGSIGHHSAIAALTGSDLRGPDDRRSKSPSLDIFLAQFLGVAPIVHTFYDGLKSWDATGEQYPANEDMVAAYQQVFGSVVVPGADPKAAAKLRAERSVLSYLRTEATTLRGRLAGTERVKLDQHLSSLDVMESKLQVSTATCTKPPAPTGRGDLMEYRLRHSVAFDIIAAALGCGLTRVATCHMAAGATMDWLDLGPGTPAVHNDVVHVMRADDEVSVRRVSRIHRWYAEQVAGLCDRLKAIPEAGGSVYDHTIIVWTNELGDAMLHEPWNVPFVLLGGGGAWRKGRYLKFAAGAGDTTTARESNAHNRLLTSVVNQFGAKRTSFGEPGITGELVGLL